MGTKRNPGAYDGYANAEEDEPMFVLLARDERAPMLVEAWADISEDKGTSPEKIAEARACASAMRTWRSKKTGVAPKDPFVGGWAGLIEGYRALVGSSRSTVEALERRNATLNAERESVTFRLSEILRKAKNR